MKRGDRGNIAIKGYLRLDERVVVRRSGDDWLATEFRLSKS